MFQLGKQRYDIRKNGYIRRIFVICCMMVPLHVQAAPASLPPHLIQSVGDLEIYEGMAALGLLECPVLEESDCGLAYENVKDCIVRIQMGEAHGSGIVWKLTKETVVVATNRHVLEYWNDMNSYIYFPQGYYVDAQIIGISDKYDVGFLVVDNGQFSCEELVKLRSVPMEEEAYYNLRQKDMLFCVDSASWEEEGRFYEAAVENTDKYIEDFDAYMLYGLGFAREGMSGGGTFDGRGYLVGMTTGGTMNNEIASVPLPALVEAYGEVSEGFLYVDGWNGL